MIFYEPFFIYHFLYLNSVYYAADAQPDNITKECSIKYATEQNIEISTLR